MPSKILLEVADYCWSKNFLDVFRKFFSDHAEAFEGAPSMHSGEHNLEYYNLFQIYLKLYENTLEKYLQTLDVTIEEFYRDVRDAQGETVDPYISTFIDCLLASADYDSFYKVMAKEGYKSLSKKQLLSTKADAKGEGGSIKENKGGDKSVEIRTAESKNRDNDDDGDKKSYK